MAQSKLEATRIERAVLAACGSGDYRSLDPVSREACVRMFRNKEWELPRDLAGENCRRDELTLWKAVELCLKYPDVKDSSNRERQEYAFARLVEKWGKDFPVKDLWIPQIKEYQIERLHDGAAPSTINKEKSALSKMFQVLIELRLVEINPARQVKNLSEKESQRKAYLSLGDFRRIVETLPHWFRPIAQTSYFTGMRRGEVVGLTRERVRLDRRLIYLGLGDRKNLLAMFNWGCQILNLPLNPVARIRNLPHDRKPQYTPPTADILKVLATATREERIFLNAYLHTGARRSEIFRWTWNEDINFERREVRLGTRKTRDGSMEYEWLPMSDELYENLWSWWRTRPIKDTPHVFVATSNRHYGKPFTTRRRFLSGLCERAGVKPFGFHALRRYVASVLADTHKVSAKTIQRILRHKNVTTTERYIQNINRDLGATMNLLSEKGYREGLPNNDKGVKNDS